LAFYKSATLSGKAASYIVITGATPGDSAENFLRRTETMPPSPHQNDIGRAQYTRILALLFGVIISISGGAVQGSSQTADPDTVLRQRMSAYWDAMQRNDYETASKYIHEESRNLFIYRVPKGPVVRWKIEQLKFNSEKTICETVTKVGRPMPIPIGNVAPGDVPDFPIENQWVLAADGEWYLKLPWKEGENPMLQMFKGQDDANAKLSVPATTPVRGEIPRPPATITVDARERFVPDAANPVALHLGEKGIYRFHYRNTGKIPIKIVSAHGDCHCTSVKQDNPEVLPGKSGALEIEVDSFGLPLGKVQKLVNVELSDTAGAMTLELRLNILPNFMVMPPFVDFGTIPRGSPVEKTVRIMNESGRKVKFLTAFKSEPQLTVTMDKAEVGPGESLIVTLRFTAAQAGEFRDRPMIRTDLQGEPLINISVRGVVKP
jgi:hypothetical protein